MFCHVTDHVTNTLAARYGMSHGLARIGGECSAVNTYQNRGGHPMSCCFRLVAAPGHAAQYALALCTPALGCTAVHAPLTLPSTVCLTAPSLAGHKVFVRTETVSIRL